MLSLQTRLRPLTITAKIEYETGKLEWDRYKAGYSIAIPHEWSPEGPCAFLAPGAGGPMYTPFMSYFHNELAKHGILMVKFNFPYMEARRHIPDRADVLEECYGRIVDHVRTGPHKPGSIFVGGKSMGGRIGSQSVAKGRINATGLFFLGYPLHPIGHPEKLRDAHLYQIKSPMLFISGTNDQFAGKDLGQVVTRIGKNATLHWVDGANHSLDPGKGKAVQGDVYASLVRLLINWFSHSAKSTLPQV